VIGCDDRLRNDLGLYSVGWGVKLYSNQTKLDLRGERRVGKGMGETWVQVITGDGEGTEEEKEGDWHSPQRRT